MKRLLFICFLFSSILGFSQNLVPNPSFEIHTSCPTGGGEINKAVPWDSPVPFSTPDLVSSCEPIYGVKLQNPHSGNSYACILAYYRDIAYSNGREYIQAPLNTELKKGKSYCVSFYVSLVGHSEVAVNKLGMYLAPTKNVDIAPGAWFHPQLINQPQLTNTSIQLTDTLNWQLLSWIYKAEGGEKFITIGNFYDVLNSDTIVLSESQDSITLSGYFIDDVSIYQLDRAGSDTLICLQDSVTLGNESLPNVAYTWFPTTGLSNPNIAQPKASPSETTTYFLTTSIEGRCSYIDTVVIKIRAVNAGKDTSICKGEKVVIGESGVSGATYHWSLNFDLSNEFASQTMAYPNITRSFTLTANFPEGCVATDQVLIQVIPIKEIFGDAGDDKAICRDETAVIGSSNNISYLYDWTPKTGLSEPNSSITEAAPKIDTRYYLTINSTERCSKPFIDSVLVRVCPEEELYVPNVFSNNNDGINDRFEIKNLPVKSVVQIFNRWGNQVAFFSDKNSWDGYTNSGLPCPDGVYYYIITIHDKKIVRGSLTLVH